jgi:hypothetical protein
MSGLSHTWRRRVPAPSLLAAAFALAAFPGRPATAVEAGAPDDPELKVPFKAGEELVYGLKVNVVRAGTATMRVVGIERVKGVATFHTVFDIKGKVLFKKVENHYESWFDTTTLTSLRHIQRVDDGEHGDKDYEFFPERRVYVRNGEEKASVAQPLDEGSFLYYVRSLPLEVGRTFTVERYYNAERNPIVIKVVRRERVKVPAGEFDAFVVEPRIKSKGLFGEEARAEVWIADTPQRTPVKLKSKLPVGTLYLELK